MSFSINVKRFFSSGLFGLALVGSQSHADTIVRTPLPHSNFPILQAVTLGAGTELTYFSGLLPDPANAGAPAEELHAGGDTAAQTEAVLKKLDAALKRQGLGFGDVVQLRIFLVADPEKGNKLDFVGLQKSYTQFFATKDQPNVPTRTTVGVASLVLPKALIEIEAVAARAPSVQK